MVFWFDPEAEWARNTKAMRLRGEKREVKGNEFSLKVEINRC